MAQELYFSREEAQALLRRVLAMSRAEQARAVLTSGVERYTRFAVNQVTAAGDATNAVLTVTSAFGRRVAAASTNRFDDASLRAVVERSEQLARLAPENPEYLGELGPQTYPEAEGFFASTLELPPQERADAARRVADPAAERGLVATGFLTAEGGSRAVATSRGLFAYRRATRLAFTTTVRTPDGTGSGWAGTGAHDWRQVDVEALARRAIEKAERSRNPQPVEPGEWTVILEPTAVANLVNLLVGALDARAADEGRSAFSKRGGGTRIGERILDERLTLLSDPADPRLYSEPFNDEGLPNRRTVWIDRGVLRTLVTSRYWAQRQGREPTGFPSGYVLQPSGPTASLEEMIASTERGLLVTRFWYIRAVDPRTLLYTGLTRDGTFLIEKGKIVGAAKNLRWNESPLFVFDRVEMIGEPVPVSVSESGDVAPSVWVPALKVRDFTFTSVSDAV